MEPNKSQIPSLKDTKKPELKVKGMAVGLSLVDRVKSFRKKDLAFIGAGLAVLFLAPLVEHFLMTPESGQPGAFKEGWTFGRGDAGSGSFGKGGSPYEPGVTGLAPGGLLGMGSEIITPLNVRDPSSLVMGPGQSSAQPVTAVAAPAAASASAAKPASDWKDALAAAAGRGAGAAAKAASLPVPKVPLQGGLRGLGVLGGGGSGASWSGGGVGPAAGSSKPAGLSSLTNIKTPTGFQGVAGKRGSSPAGSIEDLKKAGDKAAEGYNRGGGAGSNLMTSADASQAIPGGGSSGGAGGSAGDGKEDKAGGANKDMRSNSRGEPPLSYVIAKENAMRQLDLDWEKKKKDEMFWPDLQRDMQKELMMSGLVKPFTEGIGGMVKEGFGFLTGRDKAAAATWWCESVHKKVPGKVVASVNDCAKDSTDFYLKSDGKSINFCKNGEPFGTECYGDKPPAGGGAGGGQTGGDTNVPASPEAAPGQVIDPKTGNISGEDIKKRCESVYSPEAAKERANNKDGGFYTKLLDPTRQVVTAYAYLNNIEYKNSSNIDCAGGQISDAPAGKDGKVVAVKQLQNDAADELGKVNRNLRDELKMMQDHIVPCIDPVNSGNGSKCRSLDPGIKPINTDLQKGIDCKCVVTDTEDKGCAPCDDVKTNLLDKGIVDGGSYLLEDINKAKDEYTWYSGKESFLKRQDEAKKSLELATKEETGLMASAAKLRQMALDEIFKADKTLKDQIEAQKGPLCNANDQAKKDCEKYAKMIEDYRAQIIGDCNATPKKGGICGEVAVREEKQKKLEEALNPKEDKKGGTQSVYDNMLNPDKPDQTSLKFAEYITTKGESAPSAGYSEGYKPGIGLTKVKPETKTKWDSIFNQGPVKTLADAEVANARKAEAARKKCAAGVVAKKNCTYSDMTCNDEALTGSCSEGATSATGDRVKSQDKATALWSDAYKASKDFFNDEMIKGKARDAGAYSKTAFDKFNPALDASDAKLKEVKTSGSAPK